MNMKRIKLLFIPALICGAMFTEMKKINFGIVAAVLLMPIAFASAMAQLIPQNQSEENDGYLNAFEADSVVWKGCLELNIEGFENPISETVLFGDTLVNGVKWKIYNRWGIKGLVRTEDARVFYMYPDDWPYQPENRGVEIVVYDFSLEEGDVFDFWGVGLTVTSVDSVELHDGRKHKRIRFDNYAGFSWIEGLGSEFYDPFELLFPQATMASTPTLMCCHVNDELLYMNPDYLDCEGTKAVQSNELIESDEVKIYADKGELRVYYAESKFDVVLFNMNGMIASYQKDNYNEAIIPLSNLDKGVYVVRIVSGNKLYSQKTYIK